MDVTYENILMAEQMTRNWILTTIVNMHSSSYSSALQWYINMVFRAGVIKRPFLLSYAGFAPHDPESFQIYTL